MNADIEKIISYSRRSGSTTYLIKAALRDPNVIIVCASARHASQLSDLFRIYINKMPRIKRWFWYKRNKGIMPIFTSSFASIAGAHRPVVFDNYAIGSN